MKTGCTLVPFQNRSRGSVSRGFSQVSGLLTSRGFHVSRDGLRAADFTDLRTVLRAADFTDFRTVYKPRISQYLGTVYESRILRISGRFYEPRISRISVCFRARIFADPVSSLASLRSALMTAGMLSSEHPWFIETAMRLDVGLVKPGWIRLIRGRESGIRLIRGS
jgi:hypothetical protein